MPGSLAFQTRSVYRTLLRSAHETFQGDPQSLVQFRSIIHQTFLSPTLTTPFKPSKPEPVVTSCSPGPTTSTSSSSSSSSASTSTSTSDPEPISDAQSYTAQLQHWSDVAKMLRENIVQGQRVQRKSHPRRSPLPSQGVRKGDGVVEVTETEAEAGQEEEEGEAVYRLRLTRHTELGDNASIKLKPPPIPTEKVAFPNRNNEARERRRRERERRLKEREQSEVGVAGE